MAGEARSILDRLLFAYYSAQIRALMDEIDAAQSRFYEENAIPYGEPGHAEFTARFVSMGNEWMATRRCASEALARAARVLR